MTALARRLGLSVPLVQAPMAGVSTPALAAAVSNAGGLGSIGVGASDAASTREQIVALKALTSRPFNVNLFCHEPAARDAEVEAAWLARLAPHFERLGAAPPRGLREIYSSFLTDDRMLEVLVRERPAVVSFHFGLPGADRLGALRQAGCLLIATVTDPSEARGLADRGIDAIVAQGYEAGGHRGTMDPKAPDRCLGTLALTRLLVTTQPLPVIAAGGIMDGSGIAAVLALGAGAAQLGTAFVSCPETSIDAGFRALLEHPDRLATTMTGAISGRLARGLVNRFTGLGVGVEPGSIPAYPVAYDAGKALHAAGKAAGDFGYGAYWAGHGVPMVRPMPAAQLVRVLEAELAAASARLGA